MAPGGGLFSTAAVAVAVSLAVHVALNSPIEPVPSPPPPAARHMPNNLLQGLEKLGEGRLMQPEDVYVDAAGGVVRKNYPAFTYYCPPRSRTFCAAGGYLWRRFNRVMNVG